MSNQIISSPTARWADRIIVQDDSPTERDRVAKKLGGPLPDSFGVGPFELSKTAFERQLIKEIANLLDTILAFSGMLPRGITSERIHILDDASYRLIIGNNTDGLSVLGHTYINRIKDSTAMAFLLTHELTHLSSHLSVLSVNRDNAHVATWKRAGYAIQTNRGNAFVGLNEAATEVIAGLVRDMLVRKKGLLNNETKKALSKGYLFVGHVFIVQALIKRIAEHENIDDSIALMELIQDYLIGRANFIRRANRTIPGAASILRGLDNDPESALVAARALGLHEIIDGIKYYVNKSYEIDT
jgi:hypothetical protein